MTVFEIKIVRPILKQLVPVIAAVIFMAPSIAEAEQLLLLYNAAGYGIVSEIAQQAVKRSADICLNENGDLVIRRGGISLVMAYSPPDEIIEPQERIRIVQRQNCPSISGISLKVSFLF